MEPRQHHLFQYPRLTERDLSAIESSREFSRVQNLGNDEAPKYPNSKESRIPRPESAERHSVRFFTGQLRPSGLRFLWYLGISSFVIRALGSPWGRPGVDLVRNGGQEPTALTAKIGVRNPSNSRSRPRSQNGRGSLDSDLARRFAIAIAIGSTPHGLRFATRIMK